MAARLGLVLVSSWLLAMGCQSPRSAEPGVRLAGHVPEGPIPSAPVAATAMTVVTYNIERGVRDPGLKNILQWLQSEKPDIVCLQEASWPKKEKFDFMHQVRHLAQALNYEWTCTRRGSLEYEYYGMGTLVRGNILSSQKLKIPHERSYGLLTQVEIDGMRWTVANVHARSIGDGPRVQAYARTERFREAQMSDLVEQLAGCKTPMVIAGDFNTIAYSPSYMMLAQNWNDAAMVLDNTQYTRLTDRIPVRIDFIFVSKGIEVVRCNVPEIDFSDHRPVIAVMATEGNLDDS